MPLNLDAVMEMMDEAMKKQETEERERAAKIKAALTDPPQETILTVPIDALEDHPSYAQGVPFHAPSEERIAQIAESIRHNGILSPLLIRPLAEGRYQILAGHTRKRAAMLVNYDKLPCIVKNVREDEATDILIADNLAHRLDGLLPSEKAFAYKMRLDSMRKRQGERTDLTSAQLGQRFTNERSDKNPTCAQVGHKLTNEKSITTLASDSPDSKTQIQRYIRLTHLIPELLQMVDAQKIGLVIGVTLSYLCEPSQRVLCDYLTVHKQGITQKTADTLRELDADPAIEFSEALLNELLDAPPQRTPRVVKLQMKPIRHYFPLNAKPEEIQQTVEKALQFYFSAQSRDAK